jgi:hypothetical protein
MTKWVDTQLLMTPISPLLEFRPLNIPQRAMLKFPDPSNSVTWHSGMLPATPSLTFEMAIGFG